MAEDAVPVKLRDVKPGRRAPVEPKTVVSTLWSGDEVKVCFDDGTEVVGAPTDAVYLFPQVD